MGISTRNLDLKNPRKQAKMIKQKKDAGIIWNRKEKTAQEKTYNKTWGNEPESTGERRMFKQISTKRKSIKTK